MYYFLTSPLDEEKLQTRGLFHHDDGGDIFVRNVGFVNNRMSSHSRRWYYSTVFSFHSWLPKSPYSGPLRSRRNSMTATKVKERRKSELRKRRTHQQSQISADFKAKLSFFYVASSCATRKIRTIAGLSILNHTSATCFL
jgi:hypothetical protein